MTRSLTMLVVSRGSMKADAYSCRCCRERPAQRRSCFAGMCYRCHALAARRQLCIRCCKRGQRRLVNKYANMCVQCFRKCDITFECRRCKGQQRLLSPHIPVPTLQPIRTCVLTASKLRELKTCASGVFRTPAIVDRDRGCCVLRASSIPLALLTHPFLLELTVESVT